MGWETSGKEVEHPKALKGAGKETLNARPWSGKSQPGTVKGVAADPKPQTQRRSGLQRLKPVASHPLCGTSCAHCSKGRLGGVAPLPLRQPPFQGLFPVFWEWCLTVNADHLFLDFFLGDKPLNRGPVSDCCMGGSSQILCPQGDCHFGSSVLPSGLLAATFRVCLVKQATPLQREPAWHRRARKARTRARTTLRLYLNSGEPALLQQWCVLFGAYRGIIQVRTCPGRPSPRCKDSIRNSGCATSAISGEVQRQRSATAVQLRSTRLHGDPRLQRACTG